jgi:molybdenum cofactor synthesis domain-containing protein
MMRACVLTLSDRGARGERADESGPAVREMLESAGARVEHADVLPDDRAMIEEWLVRHAGTVDLILTTGGTGLAPRDVTPEATRAVLDYEVPGLAEAMRGAGLRNTPRAMLSRAVAGVRGGTLIVNLPGSVKAVQEGLGAIIAVLPHAVEKLRGGSGDCGR